MRTSLSRNGRPLSASLLRNIFTGARVSERTEPEFLGVTQNGSDRIDLSWTSITGATSYDVQSSTNGGTTWSALVTQAGTTYSHTGLSFPGSYTYRVRATVGGVNSNWSAIVTETMVDVPAAPGGLTVTGATTSSISLSWNDTADEGSYLVESSVDGLGSWTSAGSTNQNVTTFTHTGLAESVQRYYRVTAFNKAGGSIPSSTANSWTVPAAPTGLTATSTSSTQIDLAWTDVSTGNTSYKVERSTDNTNWTEIATGLSSTATSYSATGLSASTLYYFRVRAANAAQNSAYSSSASATTQSGGALSPSWSIDWSSGTPSGYTFTRASTGTYVDSSGYIASASTNVARLTHNSSGSRLGLLVEEARTNRAPKSDLFDNTLGPATTRTTQTSIVTPASSSGSASKVSGTLLSASSALYYTENNLASGDYAFSVYAKADGVNFVYVAIATLGEAGRYFDLSNGTAGNTVGTLVSSGIEAAGNGWYRCWVVWNNPSSQTSYPMLLPSTTNATGRSSQAGTSPNGVLVWGAQFEAASTISSYVANTGTGTTTRSADLAHVLDSSITSWGDPGALVIHFYPPGKAGTLLSTDDASTAQVGIEASTTTAARAFWSSGSTSTGTIGSGVQKAVHYWNGSTSQFCINGGTVQSGTNNLTIANTDFVTFGAEATDSSGSPGTFSQYANCVIRKVEFYTGTLTDANLQTITT